MNCFIITITLSDFTVLFDVVYTTIYRISPMQSFSLGGANISRHGSIGHSPVPSSPYHHYKSAPIGPGRSPQLPARFYHGDLNHHRKLIYM